MAGTNHSSHTQACNKHNFIFHSSIYFNFYCLVINNIMPVIKKIMGGVLKFWGIMSSGYIIFADMVFFLAQPLLVQQAFS